MYQVMIARRLTDPLWRTLRAIEVWLAENEGEHERLRVRRLDHNTVVFQLSFACPLQACRFGDAFGSSRESETPSALTLQEPKGKLAGNRARHTPIGGAA